MQQVSAKDPACEVQETGFPCFHKFQWINICVASSFVGFKGPRVHPRPFAKLPSASAPPAGKAFKLRRDKCDVSFTWVSGLRRGEKHGNLKTLNGEKMWSLEAPYLIFPAINCSLKDTLWIWYYLNIPNQSKPCFCYNRFMIIDSLVVKQLTIHKFQRGEK